jgi:hypothetical protein
MPDDGPLWTETCSILSPITRVINVCDSQIVCLIVRALAELEMEDSFSVGHCTVPISNYSCVPVNMV